MAYRPPTGGARPGSGLRGVPGTSSGRGGARLGGVPAGPRPLTQAHGVSAVKTASGARPGQPRVQDNTYYVGLLRKKTIELREEIGRLNDRIEQAERDGSQYGSLERRYESLQREVRELLQSLGDLNVTAEKIADQADPEELLAEAKKQRHANEQQRRRVDGVFTQRSELQARHRRLTEDLHAQRALAEQQLSSLSEQRRAQYHALQAQKEQLQEEHDGRRTELDAMNAKIRSLEEHMRSDPAKRSAVDLHQRIAALEAEGAAAGGGAAGAPLGGPEERERLLAQVKDDNRAIAQLDARLIEVQNNTDRLRMDLEQVQQDIGSRQGDRGSKMAELEKRDRDMQAFLDGYDELRATELQACRQAEHTIVAVLEHISRGLEHERNLPSAAESSELQQNLEFKESEMHKAATTQEKLGAELQLRRKELADIGQLDVKINDQLKTLNEKLHTMRSEMAVYSDVGGAKRTAEDAKRKLLQERASAAKRKDTMRAWTQALTLRVEDAKGALARDDSHQQLNNVEEKLRHHEQNAYALRHFINVRSMETDFTARKDRCMGVVAEINQLNIELAGREDDV